MSFNSKQQLPQKVAIIGSGVTGLAAASFLIKQGVEVVLFEKDSHVGGHCYTFPCKYSDREPAVDVDLGFMVLNPVTYNNFIKWLRTDYNVEFELTNMSFSACMQSSRTKKFVEWSSNNPFSDPSNWFKKDIWRMMWDILRSEAIMYQELAANKHLKELKNLENNENDVTQTENKNKNKNKRRRTTKSAIIDDKGAFNPQTVAEFQKKYGLSDAFMKYFLLPQCGSIWSKPDSEVNDMPSDFLLTFMFKHQLNSLYGRPMWWTVKGRSQTYVQKILKKHFSEEKGLNRMYTESDGKIVKLEFDANESEETTKITVVSESGLRTVVNHVLFACHPKFALKILNNSNGGPTQAEMDVLKHFDCGFNEVYLHDAEEVMPRYKESWAAWNYTGTGGKGGDRVNVSYYLNILQNYNKVNPSVPNLFATLNPTQEQKKSMEMEHKVYHVWHTTHPKFTSKSYEMVKMSKLDGIQCSAKRGLSFAGAWTGYGFHRDGFLSGMKEAHRIVGKVYEPEPVVIEKGVSFWISFVVNNIHNIICVLLSFVMMFCADKSKN